MGANMIPWFQYNLIHLGLIPIRVWGFFVASGMALSVWIIWRRSRRVGLDPEIMTDLAVWMIIGGILGARLFHVFFYEPVFYFTNPLEIFKVWHGGLSSFGGLFGAAAGFFAYLRKNNLKLKIYKLKFADALAFAAVYGWMVGRLGCVMIHDHLGRLYNGLLAIQSPYGPRLEMAMLEILGMIPLAVWFYIKRKKTQDGWYLNTLFIYYGALRFILDFFRASDLQDSDARYLGLTPAQYFAMVLVVLGARFFIKQQSTQRKNEKSVS